MKCKLIHWVKVLGTRFLSLLAVFVFLELYISMFAVETENIYRFIDTNLESENVKSAIYYSFEESPETYYNLKQKYTECINIEELTSDSFIKYSSQLHVIDYSENTNYCYWTFYNIGETHKLLDVLIERYGNYNIRYQQVMVGVVYCDNEKALRDFCTSIQHPFLQYEYIMVSPLDEKFYIFEMKVFS